MRTVVAVLMFALAVLQPANASAQVYAQNTGQIIPNAQQCGGVPSFVGPTSFWAQVSMTPYGPIITYGPGYFGLPPVMQRFTSIHECGHIMGAGSDEFAANCFALRNGNWSRQDVAFIADYHRRIGMLAPQYGGSGQAFWAMTIQYCPEFGGV